MRVKKLKMKKDGLRSMTEGKQGRVEDGRESGRMNTKKMEIKGYRQIAEESFL